MTYPEFHNEWLNSENFIRVFTSGSTGIPKEIRLSKEFMVRSAERTNNFFGITSESHLHSCISPDFIGGKMMAVRAWISGAKFTWEEPSNDPLSALSESDVPDLVSIVPSQMLSILENKGNLPSVKNFLIGGSSIHPELKRKIASSKFNAYESYGMTETASHIALRKITNKNTPFQTLPGIHVENDKQGRLIINFDKVLRVKTNDLAKIISPDTFYIIGRYDQMIISGGRKINPQELETGISKILGIPCCITGLPDEKWGQKIVLLIPFKEFAAKEQLSNGRGNVNLSRIESENFIAGIRQTLRLFLPGWMMPKEIIWVKKIPLTANGKILRIKDPLALSSFVLDIDPSSSGQSNKG